MKRYWGDGRATQYRRSIYSLEARRREMEIVARRNGKRRPIESFGDPDKIGEFRFCKWIEDEKFCHTPISRAQTFAFCDEHKKRALRQGENNDDF